MSDDSEAAKEGARQDAADLKAQEAAEDAKDDHATRLDMIECKIEHLFESLGHILPPMKD